MLRPRGGFLDSSRAARSANLRAERRKAIVRAAHMLGRIFRNLCGAVFDLLLLWGLPILYLAASYLVVDLPLRWLVGRTHFSGFGLLLFAGSVILSLIGISRAVQNAQPIAPVRPRFAKTMFALSWVAAVLLTIADLGA